MVLPEQSKMRARIHMGVPVLGVQDSGYAFGYRFSTVTGLFEYRMNNLQPWEASSIIGLPIASAQFSGLAQAGQVITAVVAGITTTYTVQSSDVQASAPVEAVVQNIAAAINGTTAGFNASAQPAVSYPVTAVGATSPYWQLAVTSTLGIPFAISITVSSGTLYAVVTAQGLAPRPFYTFTDDSYTATGYIAICDYLESKVGAASDLSSKYSVADVVTFRRDELAARDQNYQWWRQKLADVFGIPLYPMQPVSGFGGNNTGLVV
jgi:hypothetical protein